MNRLVLRVLSKYTRFSLPRLQFQNIRFSHSFPLRDYQQKAIDLILESSNSGVKRQAIEMATGSGKTVVFSHLIPLLKQKGTRALVLAHTQELITQSRDKINKVNPDLKVGIEMGKVRSKPDDDVVVASVMSLARSNRLERFNPNEFKTIIIDECHHAVAPSYLKILKHFHADTKDTDIHVIGFTATLARTDKQKLGTVFDKIVFQRSLPTMIENKELAEFKISNVNIKDLNLKNVPKKGGDYDSSSLYLALNQVDINEKILLAYMELAKDYKSTIIFCVNVEHCREVCGLFQQQGIDAQYVLGETSKIEREFIVEDFKQGKFPVLCNVGVFTEGTDIPNIDSIILARPTMSQSLMIQMIGRGLRLHKEKSHCHVIDLVGITKSSLALKATLSGEEPQEQEKRKYRDEKDSEEEDERLDDLEYIESIKSLHARRKLIVERALYYYNHGVSELQTIDGIQLFQRYMLDIEVVKDILMKGKLPWVALHRDSVWGVGGLDDTFFLIEKIKTNDRIEFKLTQNQLSRHSNSNHEEVEHIYTSSNILELMQKLDDTFPEHASYTAKYNTFRRKCHRYFAEFIISKLNTRISKYCHENGLERQQFLASLNDVIRGLHLVTAYRLKFALTYSPHCDYSIWKGNQLLAQAVTNCRKNTLSKYRD